MEFTDRVLKCSDCGAEFVFTAGEQLFFHDKQFKNEPRHCKQLQGAPGNPDQLLAVRRGDDGSLQAHAGQAGVVPLLLQAADGPTGAHPRPAATPRVAFAAVTPGRGLRAFCCLS